MGHYVWGPRGRDGSVAEAQRISTAPLEAAEYSDGRLPDLPCGFSRDQSAEPVPYPAARSRHRNDFHLGHRPRLAELVKDAGLHR